MNKLSLERQAQVIKVRGEGNSLSSTARITGVTINVVRKLLNDFGTACLEQKRNKERREARVKAMHAVELKDEKIEPGPQCDSCHIGIGLVLEQNLNRIGKGNQICDWCMKKLNELGYLQITDLTRLLPDGRITGEGKPVGRPRKADNVKPYA